MNDAVKIMLNKYNMDSINDYENAFKEIIQEIALLGLYREKFFEKAAFYGGSALRILYLLDRFSEDLDFSLLEVDNNFNIDRYLNAVERELKSFGFELKIERKVKIIKTDIQSAFIKANTLNNLIIIDMPDYIKKKIHKNQSLKIKLEIDTNPPSGFSTDVKYLLNPIPFSIKTYSLPDLFAGKMHAILCREWKNRIKGRDWYDLVWYLKNNIKLNLSHLEMRMKQTNHIGEEIILTKDIFMNYLKNKILRVDFELAKNDVYNLIKKTEDLDIWSKNFFLDICKQIEFL